MEKRCFSVKTPDFDKAIKSLGKPKIEKMLEKIKKLEDMENDHSLLPQGIRTPELAFGKNLTKMGKKNIYVLELGDDRAMAVVTEKENKKVYIWFWGGSHEDYNKKLKARALHDSELSVTASQASVVEEKLKALKKEAASVQDNIKDIRNQYSNYSHNHDKKFKKKHSM